MIFFSKSLYSASLAAEYTGLWNLQMDNSEFSGKQSLGTLDKRILLDFVDFVYRFHSVLFGTDRKNSRYDNNQDNQARRKKEKFNIFFVILLYFAIRVYIDYRS